MLVLNGCVGPLLTYALVALGRRLAFVIERRDMSITYFSAC
jgi:hypothetical protein